MIVRTLERPMALHLTSIADHCPPVRTKITNGTIPEMGHPGTDSGSGSFLSIESGASGSDIKEEAFLT